MDRLRMMQDMAGWPASHWHHLAAPPLALLIFAVDTFTDLMSAIAVLYVLVMLIAARPLTRRGLILAGIGCQGLAILSFAISHGLGANVSAVLRLAVALAAILITTMLLLRDQASRARLMEAHAALTRSERRYRLIFENARFSLWEQDYAQVGPALAALRAAGVTDLADHARRHPGFADSLAALIVTIDVNEATLELMGAQRRADVLGPLGRFLPPDRGALVQVLQALLDGRDHFEGRGAILGLDGRVRTVLLGITFPEEGDGLSRVITSLVDITAREETQEALLAARAELARAARVATVGALSASIAHELNQPLGALVMNAQTCLRWLRRDPPDIASASAAAERTVRDGMRASELVRKTRGMLVKGERQDETIDPRQLVEEVLPLLEREIGASGARVATRIAPDVGGIRASRIEMQQVLINLIGNGLQAMAQRPAALRELTLAIEAADADHVLISVADRGTGIREEDLPKLFDPFFTTKADGMGLGLAICRAAIEAAGGSLSVRNRADGGAVFDCLLPAAARQAA
ncbi:sensor histidine kinase [Roseomonas hellenica]|nr:sensor histidine kinase [Plastoroseomonas hellenica]